MRLLLHSRGRRFGDTEHVPIIEKYMNTAVSFIVSRSTEAISHGHLAFAETSRDNCHAQ